MCLSAEAAEVRTTSETWRKSYLTWSKWGAAVLRERGIQLEDWGDEPAREKIAELIEGAHCPIITTGRSR